MPKNQKNNPYATEQQSSKVTGTTSSTSTGMGSNQMATDIETGSELAPSQGGASQAYQKKSSKSAGTSGTMSDTQS